MLELPPSARLAGGAFAEIKGPAGCDEGGTAVADLGAAAVAALPEVGGFGGARGPAGNAILARGKLSALSSLSESSESAVGGAGAGLAAALGVVTLDLDALVLGAAVAGTGTRGLAPPRGGGPGGCTEAAEEGAEAELDVERRLPVGEALLERGL